MFIEFRHYLLRPGTAIEAEQRFAEPLRSRSLLSPMAGLWHSDSGLLNRIVHIWPYESLDQRAQIRSAAIATGQWPPKLREMYMEMNSWIIVAAPFSPPLGEHKYGRLYEICIDSYRTTEGPKLVLASWQAKIAERVKISPLVCCGHTDFGPVNQWVHIWAYKDAADRERVQEVLRADGDWSRAHYSAQGGGEELVRQESWLMVPAACSPLQ